MTDNLADCIGAHLQEGPCKDPLPRRQGSASAPLSPLHTRLQKLLDEVPESAKQQGLSLLSLQPQLRGRKGGMPHIGELGAAMRRLGWKRRRTWSDEDTAFSSKWYLTKPN